MCHEFYLSNKIFYFCYVLYFIFLLPNAVVTLELAENIDDANVTSLLQKFPLIKCHCGADQVWQFGVCVPTTNTSVDIILSFDPPFSRVHVDTNRFDLLQISNLACNESTIPVAVRNVAFISDHSLLHLGSGEIFTEYCVEHVFNRAGKVSLEASVCLPLLSIPSCCPPQQLLDDESLRCVKNQNFTYHPPIRLGDALINSSDYIHVEQKIHQSCPRNRRQKRILDSMDNVTLEYQRSKVILVEYDDDRFPKSLHQPTEFCVGVGRHPPSTPPSYAVIFCDDEYHHLIEHDSEHCEQIMYWVTLPFLIVSTVCLFVILCLQAAMPELRKSLGSKITICHVVSLFGAFCVILVLHIPQDFNCKIYGPLVQCLFHAAFFWLNVMCFDIWWKLRFYNPAGETVQSSNRRFIKYSVYAWVTPVVICMVTIFMDNAQLDDLPTWVIRPGFGIHGCWFSDYKAALVYYFGIVAVLMSLNVIFFIWVFVILIKANFTYDQVLKNNTKAASRTWIHLKVFSIMGITWIFEFVSWQEGTCKYWAVTDIINALRGLILFAIFFANRKSAIKIRERATSFNQTFHTQWSRSVKSIRKLSQRTSNHSSFTNGLDSRRTSETASTDLSHKLQKQDSNGSR